MSLLKNATDNIELGRNLTHEMIHSQTDTAFLKEVEDRLSGIKNFVIQEDVRNIKYLLDNETIVKYLKEINQILTKRFGFEINIINRAGSGLSTIPVYPPHFNVLNGESINFLKDLSSFFNSKDMLNKIFKKASDIKDKDNDSNDVYNNIYKSYKALKDTLDKNKVSVDLKNARINNLPKEYNVFIFVDICYILHNKGQNRQPQDIMAGILHEIGHTFTAFEKSIYSVYNTMVLLDTIREVNNNKNNDIINVLEITNQRLGFKSDKKGDTINALTAISDALSGYSFTDDKTRQNARISSEQQADQFTSRFGYGKHFIEGLDSYGYTFYRANGTLEMDYEQNKPGIIILFIFLMFYFPVGIPIMIFMVLSNQSEVQNYNKFDKKYDGEIRRILRIKQDAIRQIRLLDNKTMEKEFIKKLEDTITFADFRIDILSNPNNRNFLNKFFDKYQYDSTTKKVVNMLEISESLMENDLHYLNLKLKEKA